MRQEGLLLCGLQVEALDLSHFVVIRVLLPFSRCPSGMLLNRDRSPTSNHSLWRAIQLKDEIALHLLGNANGDCSRHVSFRLPAQPHPFGIQACSVQTSDCLRPSAPVLHPCACIANLAAMRCTRVFIELTNDPKLGKLLRSPAPTPNSPPPAALAKPVATESNSWIRLGFAPSCCSLEFPDWWVQRRKHGLTWRCLPMGSLKPWTTEKTLG